MVVGFTTMLADPLLTATLLAKSKSSAVTERSWFVVNKLLSLTMVRVPVPVHKEVELAAVTALSDITMPPTAWITIPLLKVEAAFSNVTRWPGLVAISVIVAT
jgi:hypothetical protein